MPRIPCLTLALLVCHASAQPVFTATVRDIGNAFNPEAVSEPTPFLLEGAYSTVTYDILPDRGRDSALATYTAGGNVGVGLTARTECDDYFITGPGNNVTAQVNLRFDAYAINRPFLQNISGRIASAGRIDQTFTVSQPVGDSNYNSDLLSNSAPFPTGTPFTISTQAYLVVGGNGVGTHTAQLVFGFIQGGQVMTLPDGYTLNSACANIVNNIYLGPNPCPSDVNGDGVVDNGDIGAFVSLFLAQDPAADFNADGIVDNGDIGAFVAAFLAGC